MNGLNGQTERSISDLYLYFHPISDHNNNNFRLSIRVVPGIPPPKGGNVYKFVYTLFIIALFKMHQVQGNHDFQNYSGGGEQCLAHSTFLKMKKHNFDKYKQISPCTNRIYGGYP